MDNMFMYKVGFLYTRKDIYDILNLSETQRGGDWHNGYHRHGNDFYIFCNIGVPGRTGHNYDNYWNGEKLIWYGKTRSHFGQHTIQQLLSTTVRTFIFYREQDRDPFTFAGIGHPLPHREIERPVRIDWVFGADTLVESPVFTDEYVPGTLYREGSRIQVLVNRYERDRAARDACIRSYGTRCAVCSMSFAERYGDLGQGFIHVHHIVPMQLMDKEYIVNPTRDLVPVCPNCHAMLHRQNPPFSVDELRSLLR